MNMKKVLAALLAVMMAVSAMAITAFAEDYTIPLYKSSDNVVGDYTYTVTLTIPVYATYGYFTEGAYFELTNLPTSETFKNGWGTINPVVWTANGYKLAEDATSAKVYFGHVAHDYISEAYPTVIPVDTTVNGTTTITLAATVRSSSQWNWKNTKAHELAALATAVQFYDANGTAINGSASTIAFWNPSAVGADASYSNNMEFVNATTWSDVILGGTASSLGEAKTWTWDHSLNNKAAVLGAETAKVVVKLDKAINGRATYTLWATNEAKGLYETNANWWDYDDRRILVSSVYVDGSVTELVFDVPLDALYDTAYGVWNDQFAITEEITLTADFMEKDPTSQGYMVDIDDNDPADNATTAPGDVYFGKGTFPDSNEVGDLTWNRYWAADGYLGLKYKGASIVYAAGGQAYAQNGNDDIASWSGDYAKYHGAEATDIYLLLSSSDNTVVEEVEDPVEPSTEEEEDVTVDVEEPAEEEDTNPGTGLALAVVPMLVAAAAVVASKRR